MCSNYNSPPPSESKGALNNRGVVVEVLFWPPIPLDSVFPPRPCFVCGTQTAIRAGLDSLDQNWRNHCGLRSCVEAVLVPWCLECWIKGVLFEEKYANKLRDLLKPHREGDSFDAGLRGLIFKGMLYQHGVYLGVDRAVLAAMAAARHGGAK